MNLPLGAYSQELARNYLKSKHYSILSSNFRTRYGEIDIIATYKDLLCFIEVKTRTSNKFGRPYESVSFYKIKRIQQAALMYIKEKDLHFKKFRIEVISIELNSDMSLKSLKHFQNVEPS